MPRSLTEDEMRGIIRELTVLRASIHRIDVAIETALYNWTKEDKPYDQEDQDESKDKPEQA